MNRSKQLLVVFTALYGLGFLSWFVYTHNWEYVGYVSIIFATMAGLGYSLRWFRIPDAVLWGLSICGLVHMAGGGIVIGSDILYGMQLLDIYNGGGEFVILKYDQVLHMIGYGIVALMVWHMLAARWQQAGWLLLVTTVLTTMGVGVVNELIEFAVTLILPHDNIVGGYDNTLLDLVFNTVGAVVVAGWVYRQEYLT